MIAVVDYQKGNLLSVQRGLAAVGGQAVVTIDPAEIAVADAIVLPGVGAFADAAATMRELGQVDVIRDRVLAGVPFLGICLGMQVLFEGSDEAPGVAGLGFFKGQVKYLTTDYKIPHMGWNKLELRSPSPLLKEAEGQYVYFVHSFHCVPEDKSLVTAVCDYGMEVTASVGRGNVQAFQFHPEKSSRVGAGLLRAFKEWQP